MTHFFAVGATKIVKDEMICHINLTFFYTSGSQKGKKVLIGGKESTFFKKKFLFQISFFTFAVHKKEDNSKFINKQVL